MVCGCGRLGAAQWLGSRWPLWMGGLAFSCSPFRYWFDAWFLGAAPLVGFTLSPREKYQASPGGRRRRWELVPAALCPCSGGGAMGWGGGAAAGVNPPKQLLWGHPRVPSCFGSRRRTPLYEHSAVVSKGLTYGGSKAFPWVGRCEDVNPLLESRLCRAGVCIPASKWLLLGGFWLHAALSPRRAGLAGLRTALTPVR